MTVITPDIRLVLWTIIVLFHLALGINAVMQLINYKLLNSKTKMICLFAILCIPFIGSVLFFVFRNQINRIKYFLYQA